MVGGTRKLWFVVATRIWWFVVFIGPAACTAVAGQDGNAGRLPPLIRPVVGSFDNVGHGPSANQDPFVRIVGYNDLCMQAFGAQVWLEACSGDEGAQIWALYPDGSIRPQQSQYQCLTGNNFSDVVAINTCIYGMPGQVWKFTEEGTIVNPYNGLVMDVKEANPSLREIIIYPPTGAPNQQWRHVPVFMD